MSENPKSASVSAGSMDELEKALGDLELLNKQQCHEEEDTEKKISSSPAMRENSKSASESAGSMDEVEKSLGDLELLNTQQHGHEEAEKVIICYGKKVLEQLLRDEMDNVYVSAPLAHQRSLKLVSTLNTLGYACLDMKMYDESLRYFNWSYKKLNELLEDGGGSSSPVLDCLIRTHCGLFKVKMAMGRKEDAPRHMKKVLDIKEKTMEEGCLGLGEAYKELYEAYMKLHDWEEALPYCLKALDIYIRHTGEDSRVVAMIRRDLGFIYTDLEKYDLALEYYLLAISVLESDGGQGLLMAELQTGYILTKLGRYSVAFGALRDVVSRDDERLGIGGRVIANTAIALALCGLRKYGEARSNLETTRRILDKEVMPSLVVASGVGDLAVLYEKNEDFETAMYLLRKVLKTPELPKRLLLKNYKRFFAVISKAHKEEEGFPYLEDAVEKLKQSFGPKHSEVGYGNIDLAVACMNLRKRREAVKYFENAKEIMDASLGPRHTHSLKTSQTLSMTYAITGRYDLAIPCQEKVVEGMKAAGPSEEGNLGEAVVLLRALRCGLRMVYGGEY